MSASGVLPGDIKFAQGGQPAKIDWRFIMFNNDQPSCSTMASPIFYSNMNRKWDLVIVEHDGWSLLNTRIFKKKFKLSPHLDYNICPAAPSRQDVLCAFFPSFATCGTRPQGTGPWRFFPLQVFRLTSKAAPWRFCRTPRTPRAARSCGSDSARMRFPRSFLGPGS